MHSLLNGRIFLTINGGTFTRDDRDGLLRSVAPEIMSWIPWCPCAHDDHHVGTRIFGHYHDFAARIAGVAYDEVHFYREIFFREYLE